MSKEFISTDKSRLVEQQQQTDRLNEATDQIRQRVDQTRHDGIRTRQQLDSHIEQTESGFRRLRVLSVVVILVAISLIGGLWYGYSYLKESRPVLTGVPELHKLVATTGDRLEAMEKSVSAWSSDRASLGDRMAKLETSVASNAKSVRNQAQAFATQMGGRIRDEFNQKMRALDSRVGGVESVQRETQDHVAQLQGEIGSLRQQVATLRQQNAEQVSQLQQAAKAETSRVNNELSTHTSRMNALNDQVDRKHVGFELPLNKTLEIAPGIYLTVKHTDVARQQLDGWLQLATEGRIVWIRSLGAQNPLTFVTRADNRAQALVFTHIGEKGTEGYLLVPTPMREASAPVSSSN